MASANAKSVNIAKKSLKKDQETVEIDENHSQKRFLMRMAWFILFVGLGVVIYQQLIRDDVLPIHEIKISGEFQQIVSEDLSPIIVDGIHGNFFTLNVSDIYEQLLVLPWVEKVWIHRIWPDTIKVELQEQKPIAILKNKGLLNEKGEVFSQESRLFDKILPKFIVANNYTQESIKQFKKIRKILLENDLKPTVFYYDERKAQKIKLSNGIELVLGRIDVEERLIKFVKAYKMQLQNDKRKILKVDLRYTNGLAISWQQAAVKLQPLLKKPLA